MTSVFLFPVLMFLKGMTDLSYVYPFLQLKNPVFTGSPGLTDLTGNLPGISEMGTGAVVMKSVFEEQIRYKPGDRIESDGHQVR